MPSTTSFVGAPADAAGRAAEAPVRNRSTESPSRQGHAARGHTSASRAVYSAIDLGTNNCRLLIARPTRGGFRVIDAFSRIVRLGEGMGTSGKISDAAMNRAVEALKVCAEKIKRRQVTCMRSVATEACRSAANCEDFVSRVRERTGLNLDVISPAEEARLAVIGCQSLLERSYPYALVFDIGGGSTELICVKRAGGGRLKIMGWTSMPCGVVSLSERFGRSRLDDARYGEMVSLVRGHLEAFERSSGLGRALKENRVQLLGTSGTITTLASVELGLERYDRNRIDGAWLSTESVHALARRVALMSHEERLAEPCIGAERADFVAAGCGILDAILTSWPIGRLRVADRGIREGVLRGMMGCARDVVGPSPESL